MKSKVRLSGYAFMLTLIVIVLLAAGCVLTFREGTSGFYFLLAIFILLIFLGLFYGPSQITAGEDYVKVSSCLRSHIIPVSDMESVELFQPIMGAYRLFGSGGYFGYWGLFRETDIGKYQAYYGKASDCFLIKMKNGDKYVLGCENPSAMTVYIGNQINRPHTKPGLP